ncbi:ACP S-malonyltransferase [Maribacter chungangensis]|uniref:Malonyl CoA-acyl carrier protein transacylase n=1 Tax=Maribacter chungangensis TaxID=1069117 RepID=A0ABW3B2S6_9FLAO
MQAYLFPGQGTQAPGMGKELFKKSKLAQAYFERGNDILGFSITDLMFNGSSEDLKQTKFAQPAIFLQSFVLTKIMGNKFKPDMVAGHSLGEISALAAVGSLDFESALRLIARRAAAMQKACEIENTGMAVVMGLYDVIVKDICKQIDGVVVPANYNAPNQVVISGEKHALKEACEKLRPGATRVFRLPVSGAFHSPYMEPIVEAYKLAIAETKFKNPNCPIYQNVTAGPTTDIELIKENLIDQLTHPVLWRQSILRMVEDGATEFTEIGPGNFLKRLVHSIDKNVKTFGIS